MAITSKQKVYQAVLHEIQKFIDSHNLAPGDKLPSERELSETLQAGRSSVREALRAMELLGLIETRLGEGTYLSTYRPYQTVELLSSFILQGNKPKKDLLLTKMLLEKEAAKMAAHDMAPSDLDKLQAIATDPAMNPNARHIAFFDYIFRKTDNLLLWKIWQLMDEFSHTINHSCYEEQFYEELIGLYTSKKYAMLEKLFEKTWKNADQ